MLLANAEGVNAYLPEHEGVLPIESITTNTTPEPWQRMHSLVWLKMTSYDLGGNMRNELARAEVMTKLSPEQEQEMYPIYPGDPAEDPLPNSDLLQDFSVKELAALLPKQPTSLGSNNWVISGENTASGKTLLANNPLLTLRASQNSGHLFV